MSLLRSIGAVLAGCALIIVLSIATDVFARRMGILPQLGRGAIESGPLALAATYRAVYAVAGGYVTARLAPINPQQHALALGGLLLVLNVVGTTSMWNQSPAWYALSGVLLAPPCAWLGGRLR